MQTYTVTIADQHSGLLTYVGVMALNRTQALWLVISTQLVQQQIAAVLNPADNLTVTVA
jgi:hypothetical protein